MESVGIVRSQRIVHKDDVGRRAHVQLEEKPGAGGAEMGEVTSAGRDVSRHTEACVQFPSVHDPRCVIIR